VNEINEKNYRFKKNQAQIFLKIYIKVHVIVAGAKITLTCLLSLFVIKNVKGSIFVA